MAYGERGAELLNLTPFRADDGSLCPRLDGFNAVDAACHVDSPDVVVGNECFDAMATPTCTCTDLDAVGEEYDGMHLCTSDGDILRWSDCMCRRRGYEAYNRGDGQPHPDEPNRCDSLGANDTKDLQAVLTHELGLMALAFRLWRSPTKMPSCSWSPVTTWVSMTWRPTKRECLMRSRDIPRRWLTVVTTSWSRGWISRTIADFRTFATRSEIGHPDRSTGRRMSWMIFNRETL
jgi:hypothetical protein